ncbi:MAG: hypothetical protein ACFE9Q_09745 [Candidatus Hodarchaeota archaeon]
MTKKIRYAYCSVCKKEVEESRRKPMETMQKVVWGIVIVATLGIAAIAYGIYLSNRPKSYCPYCFTKLEYSDKPFEKPKKKQKDMTPKEKILDKTGFEEEAEEKPDVKTKEKKEKKKKLVCSYCGEQLEEDLAICPFCQAKLKS